MTVLPNQATQDKVYILTFFFFLSFTLSQDLLCCWIHQLIEPAESVTLSLPGRHSIITALGNRYRDGTVSDVNSNRRRTDQLRCFALLFQVPKKQQAPTKIDGRFIFIDKVHQSGYDLCHFHSNEMEGIR